MTRAQGLDELKFLSSLQTYAYEPVPHPPQPISLFAPSAQYIRNGVILGQSVYSHVLIILGSPKSLSIAGKEGFVYCGVCCPNFGTNC